MGRMEGGRVEGSSVEKGSKIGSMLKNSIKSK